MVFSTVLDFRNLIVGYKHDAAYQFSSNIVTKYYLHSHSSLTQHINGDVTVLLVSTYVVCERLSVMHEPAGVVEILVQILREYPYSAVQNTPPP